MPAKEELWEHLVSELIRGENPSISDVEIERAMREIKRARALYDRYSEATSLGGQQNHADIRCAVAELRSHLSASHIRIRDQLNIALGNLGEVEKLIGTLSLIEEQIVAMEPGIRRGRPKNRDLHEWVTNMARVFEEQISRNKATHTKNSSFRQILTLCAPETLPKFGSLSPRTLKRILDRDARGHI